MPEDTQKKGLLDSLNGRSSFLLGLAAGLAVMFTIGFFVLAFLYFSDDTTTTKTIGTGTTNTAVAGTDTAGNTQINVAPVTKDDWVRGNRNAKVSVIEYSDIDCPFCQRFHPTLKQMLDQYGDQVNWVHRHFPLTSLHPNAAKKAEAVECVGELGGNDKAWAFLDKLYGDNVNAPVSQMGAIAVSIGVDQKKVDDCVSSGKYTSKITADIQAAQAAGGTGTPYSVIVADGELIPFSGAQPYDSLKAILDQLL